MRMPTQTSLEGFKEVLDNSQKPPVSIVEKIILDSKETDALITSSFILFKQNDNMYFVSFNINKHDIQQIAMYTNLLTLYLYDQLYIYHDCFIDSTSGEISFAADAYKKMDSVIHKKYGTTKCPLCQRVVPKNIMNDELGYCNLCKDLDIPNATFH